MEDIDLNDLDMDGLKNMSSLIQDEITKQTYTDVEPPAPKPEISTHTIPQSVKSVPQPKTLKPAIKNAGGAKRVTIKEPVAKEQVTSGETKISSFNIFGHAIPKSTIYLFIILLIIGIIIWYMINKKSKSKSKSKDEEE